MKNPHSFFLLDKDSQFRQDFQIYEKDHPELFHQLSRVLRIKSGEHIYLLDNFGNRYLYMITKLGKLSLDCELQREETRIRHETFHLHLPPLEPKNIELILEMTTQMGVTDFSFFTSEFSGPSQYLLSENKQTRFQKIIKEAAEQSEQFYLPRITFSPEKFSEVFAKEGNTIVLIERKNDTIKNTLTGPTHLTIGPEGGWSDREIQYMKKDKEIISLSLGSSILRAETAAIAGTVLLMNLRMH